MIAAQAVNSRARPVIPSRARHANHAVDILDARHRAPQLREVLHVEREAHVRQVVAALRAHRRDVDSLARQRIADVAQQALAIVGRHGDIYRVVAAGPCAPPGLDQPFGMRFREPLEAGAVLAMDRDTLAARRTTAA